MFRTSHRPYSPELTLLVPPKAASQYPTPTERPSLTPVAPAAPCTFPRTEMPCPFGFTNTPNSFRPIAHGFVDVPVLFPLPPQQQPLQSYPASCTTPITASNPFGVIASRAFQSNTHNAQFPQDGDGQETVANAVVRTRASYQNRKKTERHMVHETPMPVDMALLNQLKASGRPVVLNTNNPDELDQLRSVISKAGYNHFFIALAPAKPWAVLVYPNKTGGASDSDPLPAVAVSVSDGTQMRVPSNHAMMEMRTEKTMDHGLWFLSAEERDAFQHLNPTDPRVHTLWDRLRQFFDQLSMHEPALLTQFYDLWLDDQLCVTLFRKPKTDNNNPKPQEHGRRHLRSLRDELVKDFAAYGLFMPKLLTPEVCQVD